jgi:hypothetical protein
MSLTITITIKNETDAHQEGISTGISKSPNFAVSSSAGTGITESHTLGSSSGVTRFAGLCTKSASHRGKTKTDGSPVGETER